MEIYNDPGTFELCVDNVQILPEKLFSSRSKLKHVPGLIIGILILKDATKRAEIWGNFLLTTYAGGSMLEAAMYS